MPRYAHPDALVSTAWVAEHLSEDGTCIVEVDLDTEYHEGHIPGARYWGVWEDLLLPDERVNDDPVAISGLLSRSGIGPDDTVILYGDASNWGAALAFWLLRFAGHDDVRLMNGGRAKWLAEDRPLTLDIPDVLPTRYPIREPRLDARALREDVLAAINSDAHIILDVRLRAEYDGELFRPGGMPGEGKRAGHIPNAVHVPWETAINDDGTFEDAETLRAAYDAHGVTPEHEIIPYCTVGGRSGHTWFVLTQLLGYPNVRLYDASWAEWGQRTDTPVE